MICLDQEDLKEIYDEGIIKKNKEIESNISTLKVKVKTCHGIEIDE